MMRNFIFLLFLFVFTGCVSSENQEEGADFGINQNIPDFVEDMFEAHGELGNYAFVFRGDHYTFEFSEDKYEYTKTVKNDSTNRLDILTNDNFIRIENGDTLRLSENDKAKYSESLNAVIYFVCLPLKLKDPAVNMESRGEAIIKNKRYDVLEVYFDEQGGGKDHEDVFYYWINQTTHQVDYLAYKYNINGGGVRFRAAYNSRMVNGMRFQDYVNYGAPFTTPLDSLPQLFEGDKLEKLSLIETVNVVAKN